MIPVKRQEIKDIINSMDESEVDDKLKEFSQTFKPTDSKPFLNMQGDYTLLDYKKGYLDMIWALKIYVESGYDENVANDLGYKVRIIKPKI